MSQHESPAENDRVAQLEQRVAELTAMMERLAPAAPAAEHVPSTDVSLVDDGPSTELVSTPISSRRNMLKLAGAAAVGAAAATVARTMPAAAADGLPMLIASQNDTTPANRTTTELVYTNSVAPRVAGALIGTFVDANMFVVRDTPSGIVFGDSSSSAYPAAIGGYSIRTVANGVFGRTSNAGYGVVGQGSGATSVGMLARGAKANVELFVEGTAPGTRADAHNRGELICDTNGGLWFCTAAGTPGTWVSLLPAPTAVLTGHYTAIVPSRVYDSRAPQPATGVLTAGGTRTLSVKDSRDLTTGAVVTADIVPAGATAVTANVTVVNTVGAGFLAVNPGGTTVVSAATVNWYENGQILNNGVNLTINANREVTVVCGVGNTDFVIDVTGYFK